jgi:stage II sporulation protein Q
MDEKKNSAQSGKVENNKDAGNQRGPRPTAAKKIMAKRWMYPAIYLGAAALIIGLMYVKSQQTASPTVGPVDQTPSSQPGTTTVTATNTDSFAWPVSHWTGHEVSMGFFPEKGTPAQQAAALVQFDHTFTPHQGLDIKATAGSSFSVTSALAGKVTSVTSNKLNGTIIEVQSDNGYTERYESLSMAGVKQGDSISQGETIGTTGTSAYEESQGNHLFFQVLKNGQVVDPASLLPAEGQ